MVQGTTDFKRIVFPDCCYKVASRLEPRGVILTLGGIEAGSKSTVIITGSQQQVLTVRACQSPLLAVDGIAVFRSVLCSSGMMGTQACNVGGSHMFRLAAY